MTCAECLSALETESLREMTPSSPVMLHCARCPECARVTTVLRDKEYETATVLNGLPPMSNPLTVAEAAVRTAKRRRVGRVAVTISGAALVGTIWVVAATIAIPALNRGDRRAQSAVRAETIALSCLSPQQAGDIIGPYLRSDGSGFSAPVGVVMRDYVSGSVVSAITVRGTAHELAMSRDLIREFESNPGAACRAPALLDPSGKAAPLTPGLATTPPKR